MNGTGESIGADLREGRYREINYVSKRAINLMLVTDRLSARDAKKSNVYR